MEKVYLKPCPEAVEMYPNNHGDQCEVAFIHHYTGELRKVSPTPYWVAADYEDIQIKSLRLRVDGWDIDDYLRKSAAERYAYVIIDMSAAYIMSPAEFREFIVKFAKRKEGSKKEPVLRTTSEGQLMIQWFEKNVNR